jgi:carbon monoxide dehydrogenase subunit G
MELTIQVAEAVPEGSVRLLLHTKGIGSTSDVQATLTLGPADHGTHVHWIAEVARLVGLLKMAPQGLIQAAAQKVIADVWTVVESKIVG